MTSGHTDPDFMGMALALARDGLGRTWPNPSVGCVIIRDGAVVGMGRTADRGRPHAETVALSQAGPAASGGTVFVTLEPCAHHGQTPPCAEALIEAGVARVVIAAADPDPRVSGRGVALLRSAGIPVTTGIRGDEAAVLYQAYFHRIHAGRPLSNMKVATSLDGRVALANGQSRWITGTAAREEVQRLRAAHDAILTGSGTVAMDDPLLTCRLAGLERRSPLRVVVDSQLRTNPEARIIQTSGKVETWIVTAQPEDSAKARALTTIGAVVRTLEADKNGRLGLCSLARFLGQAGLSSLLIEAGPGLNAAWLSHGLVDLLTWFRAPIVMGGDALPVFGDLHLSDMSRLKGFRLREARDLGADRMEIYENILKTD